MCQFYNIFTTGLGKPYAHHNDIVDVLTKHPQIEDWASPQHGHFLVKTDGQLGITALRRAVKLNQGIHVFVAPLNPRAYSYVLDAKHADRVGAWLDKYAVDFYKNETKTLRGEFEKYTVILPDGAEVVINQDGSVYVCESDQPPKLMRPKADLAKNIIK